MRLQPTSGAKCATPRWPHILADGRHVVIRPLASGDREAERAFISSLSSEARHFRFGCAIGEPGDPLLDQLTRMDATREVAFAAVAAGADAGDGRDRIVGISRYAADADGRRCECAVVVADDWQHHGLGVLLMERLIETARTRGIRQMYSVDPAANAAMRELAAHLGFHTRRNPEDATEVIHELDL
ncbi:MAG TPA: GNAT family N-acetyltransferase [Xanthomonadaceae bacterium]|nr:GNAT family N-acetyltransferase [Xanthomonadaceae bacterium]